MLERIREDPILVSLLNNEIILAFTSISSEEKLNRTITGKYSSTE